MMETNLSNGMNEYDPIAWFFGFVIVMSAVLFSFEFLFGGEKGGRRKDG